MPLFSHNLISRRSYIDRENFMTLTNLSFHMKFVWNHYACGTECTALAIRRWSKIGAGRNIGPQARYISYIIHARLLKKKKKRKPKMNILSSVTHSHVILKMHFFLNKFIFFHGIWNINEYPCRCFHIMKVIGKSGCHKKKTNKKCVMFKYIFVYFIFVINYRKSCQWWRKS